MVTHAAARGYPAGVESLLANVALLFLDLDEGTGDKAPAAAVLVSASERCERV